MIFLKKQHEEIAGGFLRRIDGLLRQDSKAVVGYSIDAGVETLKLKIGKTVVEMKIEGAMWHHAQPAPEIKGPPENPALEPYTAEEAKEILY